MLNKSLSKDSWQRIINKRFEKKLKRKGKRFNPNKVEKGKLPFVDKIIKAPIEISIYDVENNNYDFKETMNFIKEIENNFGTKTCLFDFSKTHTFTAAASLIVFSALENSLSKGTKKSSIRWSNSNSTNKLIKLSNIGKLIINKKVLAPKIGNRYLPIVSSTQNNYADEIVDHIKDNIFNGHLTPEREFLIGSAVSETIGNVSLHAYPNGNQVDRKWWLICQVLDDHIFLAIYDSGVGIPKTVVDKPWFFSSLKKEYPQEYQQLKTEFPDTESKVAIIVPKKLHDCQLIYLSMKGDISGTKKNKHGQGSKSIKGLVRETAGGKLWVFSNNGLYTLNNPAGNEQKCQENLVKLSQGISGTLVQWNIRI